MNNDIEGSIIIVLLNDPHLINTVAVNSEWFVDHNYKAIFDAIDELGGSDAELMNIYGKAKMIYPDLTLSFHELIKLQGQFITAANLYSNVKYLHKLAVKRDVDVAVRNYQKSPFAETEQGLLDALNNLKNIGEVEDSGDIKKTLEDLQYRLDHEQPSGIKTYKKLDTLLAGGLYGSMLLTIGARPSVGKTAYSVNLAYEILKQDPEIHLDYFTLEMSKREMINRFVSRDTGFSSQLLRNPASELNDIQKEIVKRGMGWIVRHDLHIYDKLPTLDGIVQTIRRNAAQMDKDKYVAIIDYVGLISVSGNKDRWIEVGQITRELKITANEFDVPIVALAQLNRGIESRNDKTPQLSDLRESGSIEQDSNVVGFLYRPYEEQREVEQLIIQKNREGSLGRINYHFNGEEMLFQEL